MPNSNLFALGATLVLTFGLIACSPDKTSDAWSVDAPQISLKSGSQIGFVDKSEHQKIDRDWSPSLREMSTHILPPDAEIVFPSLMSVNPAVTPFDILITSACSFGKLRATQQKTLHQIAHFSLLTILPDALAVTDLSDATAYSCAVNLGVKNQLGSVENFTLPAVYVDNLNAIQTLTLENFNSHAAVAENAVLNESDAHEYVLTDTASVGPATTELICDTHVTTKHFTDLGEMHLNDLIPAPDARDARWQQTCRVAIAPDGHPEKLALSKKFILKKPMPTIAIDQVQVPCAEYLHPVVQRFSVTNTSAQSQIIAVGLPKRIHGFELDGYWRANLEVLDTGLSARVNDVVLARDDERNVWLQLAAGERKAIDVIADQSPAFSTCTTDFIYTLSDLTENWFRWANGSRFFPLDGPGYNPITVEQTGHYTSLAEVKIIGGRSDSTTPMPIFKGSLATEYLQSGKQSAY